MDPSYNNSVGSQGGQPIVSSISGGGGIVVGTEKRKKKQMWVWGALALGLLSVIVVVVFMVVPRDNSQVYSVKDLFNRYTNYYFLGTDSTQDFVMDEMVEGDAYFSQQLADGFADYDYVIQLRESFSDFRERYVTDNKDNEYASDLLNNYASELNLTTTYFSLGGMMIGDVAKAFFDGGKGGAEEYVETVVNNYQNVGIIYGYSYYDLLAEWGNDAVELLNYYNNNGCLKETGIDYVCVAGIDNGAVFDLSAEMGSHFSKMTAILNTSTEDVYSKIVLINDVLLNVENENV